MYELYSPESLKEVDSVAEKYPREFSAYCGEPRAHFDYCHFSFVRVYRHLLFIRFSSILVFWLHSFISIS